MWFFCSPLLRNPYEGENNISVARPIFHKATVAVIKPYLHSVVIYPLNAAFPFFCFMLRGSILLGSPTALLGIVLGTLRWVKLLSCQFFHNGTPQPGKTRQWQERLRRGSQTSSFLQERRYSFPPYSLCSTQNVCSPSGFSQQGQIQNCPLLKKGVKKDQKYLPSLTNHRWKSLSSSQK